MEAEEPQLAKAGRAHVLVDDIEQPILSPEDSYHLSIVRRLKDGETITLGDGRGSWRMAVIVRSSRKSKEIDFELLGDAQQEKKPFPKIVVGFVMPSLDRATWAVQKMTELGVDEIHLLGSEFSVARIDSLGPQGKDFSKLKKVIRESVMQCRSPYSPEVFPVVSLCEFVFDHPGCAMCVPFGEAELTLGVPTIIGPEGGFTHDEMSIVSKKVGLSSNILRSETAAVAVAAVMAISRSRFSRA